MGLLAASMSHARVHVDLPPPAIIKPLELWTGKQARTWAVGSTRVWYLRVGGRLLVATNVYRALLLWGLYCHCVL